MKTDSKALWEQVKANIKRLDDCPRHFFSATEVKLGLKLTCDRCGGTMGLVDIGNYIRGFEAAGRHGEEIWPSFHRKVALTDEPKRSE